MIRWSVSCRPWHRRLIDDLPKPSPHYYGYNNGVTTLKLTAIGTSTGVILPKQLLSRMRLEKGDQLFAVETPDGILLTPYDPEIQKQLEIGDKLLQKHRDVFRALAK